MPERSEEQIISRLPGIENGGEAERHDDTEGAEIPES
jgi:hypothetical protein